MPLSLSPLTPSPSLKSRVLAAATGRTELRTPIFTRVFWAAAAVVLFSIIIGTLGRPDDERYVMKGVDERAAGHVDWNDRTVKVRASGLAALPAGKIYELWHIPKGGKPIPAGVYVPDASGNLRGTFVLPGPVAKHDVFAVTLEPAPGTEAPSGPFVLKP